jgi:hypothetical protein
MAGSIVQVIPKRTLDFSAVSSGTGQAQEIVLAQGIDVSTWREASLMVRTHANSFSGNIGQIDIYAYMEGRTPEDPGILFATTTPLGGTTVTINNSSLAGSYAVMSLPANIGAMIKVLAKGTRSSSATGNFIQATVSVDLSFKSA